MNIMLNVLVTLQAKVPIGNIVGTSSGAISGSLYAAGYSAEQV